MGKKLVYFLFFIFLLTIVSAVPPVTTVASFPTGYVIVEAQQSVIELNHNYTYHFYLYNTSNGININDSDGVNCTFVMANLYGEILFYSNVTHIDSGNYWEVNISGDNFDYIGEYSYGVNCQNNNGGGVAGTFQTSYSGNYLSEGQSILYIGFLAILVLAFFLNFVGLGMLPARNQTDEEGRIMSVSYLKYFRNVLWMTGYFIFIAIFYISSNIAFTFLSEQLVAKFLFMIFSISLGLAPVVVIVWVVWIFASIFQDKEFQKILNRGMFPQSRI